MSEEKMTLDKFMWLVKQLGINTQEYKVYNGFNRLTDNGFFDWDEFDRWLHFKFGDYEEKNESMEEQVNKLPYSELIKLALFGSEDY